MHLKPNLFFKLFLAILLSLTIVVSVMIGSTHWSFRQGLAEYLEQVEAERMETLANILAAAYEQNGGWEFLRGNRRHWIELVRQALGRYRQEQEAPPPEPGGPPPLPPWPPHPLTPPPDLDRPPPPRREPWPPGRRLRLLDAERLTIVGPAEAHGPENFYPVTQNRVTIGWLAAPRREIISDRLSLAFMEQQKYANYVTACLALSLSILSALILTRLILKPLSRIAAGVQNLAAGQYDQRIEPAGQDELGQLIRHVNHLAHTLKTNEGTRRQWIADIAHELRTPLAVLQGEIEALQDGVRSPTPERIRSLHTEVSALAALVNDLHELSLADLNALECRLRPVNLLDVLEEMRASFQPRFEEKGLELRFHAVATAEIPVFADAARLYQLFSNLAENSRRYTNSGGFCEVSVTLASGRVVVDFKDSAPAVPDEALPRLFERLYRVDESRSRDRGGAGLGLAICKGIVDAHSGFIHARHSEHGGLWIQVELPSSTESEI